MQSRSRLKEYSALVTGWAVIALEAILAAALISRMAVDMWRFISAR